MPAEGIQRAVPDLVEHPQRPFTGVGCAQLGKAGAKRLGQALALLRAVDRLADHPELLGQPVEASLRHHQHGNTELLQLLALAARHAVRPEQDQIGAQAEQGLHLHLSITPHRRYLSQGSGTFAAVQHTGQAVYGIEFQHDFAERGRQAYYPLRGNRRQRGQQCQGGQQQETHQCSCRGIR